MTKLYTTPYGEEFDSVLSRLLEVESPVVTNDPDDPGKLTCCGISRAYNPHWPGWKDIDEGLSSGKIKLGKTLPKEYIENTISSFYFENYWTAYGCDLVPPSLAEEMFDQAVNPGPGTMVKNLQEILNTLNYDTKTKTRQFDDLVVDGKWGKNTKARLLEYAKKYTKFITLAMNCKQGSYYLGLASSSVAKRKYVKGWINNRIKLN